MSPPVVGLSTLRGDGLRSDPRESLDVHRPEIEALFAKALAGQIPRNRDLKSWEPARLNERHLAMVMARAGGLQQRQIAKAFGATDSNVSIVLNHPDAEFLLMKLGAMRATSPSGIQERLERLAEPAMKALEEVFEYEPDPAAFRRAPLAFKVLEMNGHGAKRRVEVDHQHTLKADEGQLALLAKAVREAQALPAIEKTSALGAVPYLPLHEGENEAPSGAPGQGSEVSPPNLLPSGTGAPSISDVQESQRPEGLPEGWN
jgi:hypothetical protein